MSTPPLGKRTQKTSLPAPSPMPPRDGIVPVADAAGDFPQAVAGAHSTDHVLAGGRRMSSLAKIPVTVITGFLGSGKTTLIRHLMTNANGKKLAVLVNEFAARASMARFLKSCADANCPEENIVELANRLHLLHGRRRLHSDHREALSRKVRPDHILIETSGLALPKPLLKAIRLAGNPFAHTVDGVIALADAEAVRRGPLCTGPDSGRRAARRRPKSTIRDAAVGGVRGPGLLADIVLLTKADLAGGSRNSSRETRHRGRRHRDRRPSWR